MNSRPRDELISAYADGEATPEERAAAEKLLAESPEAREYLEHIRSLSGLLKSLPVEPAPRELAGAVLQRAERATLLGPAEPVPAQRPSRRSISIVAALSVTATIALAVTITLKMYEPVPPAAGSPASPASSSLSVAERDLAEESVAVSADAGSLSKTADAYKASEAQAAESGAAAPLSADRRNRDTDELKYFYSDLKNAKVGDLVDAWRQGTQDVVVVQLTVVDRRQGLDSLQVVLADSGVPKESPARDEGLKPNGNGYYAVYLESDPAAAEKVLSQLQLNQQVTDMHVAGLMATEDLNADFARNGYSAVPVPQRTPNELFALRNARNLNFEFDRLTELERSPSESARKEVPASVAGKSPAPALKAGSSAAKDKDKNAPGSAGSNEKKQIAQSRPAQKKVPARESAPGAGQQQAGLSFAVRNRQRQLVVPSTPADHNADGLADFARQMGAMGGMGGGLGRGTAQPVARPEPPPFPEPLEELAQTLDESKTTGKSIPAEQSQAAEPAGTPVQTAQRRQLAAGVKVLFVVVPQSNPAPPAAPAEKADDCLEEKS